MSDKPSWLDISWPIQPDMLVFPGDPAPIIQPLSTVAKDGYQMLSLGLYTHVGTHLDAPAHFFENGLTVDQAPPETLCGPALVVDARPAGNRIGRDYLQSLNLEGVTRLLFRTDNERLSGQPFSPEFAHLVADGADYLAQHTSVRLVGIDYLSIEGMDDPAYPVHHILLGAEPPVFILEGLDLSSVVHGVYELVCLPLRIANGDGAPCRAAVRRLAS